MILHWLILGGAGFVIGWIARSLRQEDLEADRRLKLPK